MSKWGDGAYGWHTEPQGQMKSHEERVWRAQDTALQRGQVKQKEPARVHKQGGPSETEQDPMALPTPPCPQPAFCV